MNARDSRSKNSHAVVLIAPQFALRRDGLLRMAFAALWEGWRPPDGQIERTFAIVTTNAGPDVAELHDRMPVVIEQADWPAWIGEAEDEPAALLHPPAAGTLRIWPVSREVNRPANHVPELLQPVGIPHLDGVPPP